MTHLTFDPSPAARTDGHAEKTVFVTDSHAYRDRHLLLHAATCRFGTAPNRFDIIAIPNANAIAADPGSFERLVAQIGRTVRGRYAPKVLIHVAGKINGKLTTAVQTALPQANVQSQERPSTTPEGNDTLIVTDADRRLHSCPTIIGRFDRLADSKGYAVLSLPWEKPDIFDRVSTSGMALSEHIGRSVAAGMRKIVLVTTIRRSPFDGLSPQARRNATHAKVAWTQNAATAISIGFRETQVMAAVAILNDSRCKHIFRVE